MPLVPVAEFGISKKLYALDPTRFRVRQRTAAQAGVYVQVDVHGIWFRRSHNGDIAVYGGLLDDSIRFPKNFQGELDLRDLVERFSGRRYAAEAVHAWDGNSFWYSNAHATTLPHWREREQSLREALANYPAVPAGHQGWYRIEPNGEYPRRLDRG